MHIKFTDKLFICYGDDFPPTVNSLYRAVSQRLYKPASVLRWEESLQWQIKQACKDLPFFKEPVCAFFCWINDRADIDNRLKSALDAMNGVVYRDDSDIKALVSLKIRGRRGFFCCVSKENFDFVSRVEQAGSCEEILEMVEKGEL